MSPEILSWYDASWPNTGLIPGDAPMMDQASVPTLISTTTDANNEGSKKHSACDECRKRKLKCSGESTGCTRCLKQNISCHYSLQKQMGRPRKRQKPDEEERLPPEDPILKLFNEKTTFPPVTGAPDPQAFLDAESLCPAPWSSYIQNYIPPPRTSFLGQGPIYEQSSHDEGSSGTPPSDSPPTPENGLAATSAPYNVWPDYSSMGQLPAMVQYSEDQFPASTTDPSGLPTATPACTCLPNLYLTLSHLSTLSQFPFSPQTIVSLETAMRTARGVLHCRICPKSVATAIQNVMLLATCMSVIGDGWNCILKRSPQEVWRAMANPTPVSLDEWTPPMEFEWRRKTRAIVRRGVYGDPNAPPSEGSLCLMDLLKGMEERQKTWHGVSHPHVTGFDQHEGVGILPSGKVGMHSPVNVPHAASHHQHKQGAEEVEEEMFCLKVVENVRNVINMIELDQVENE